MLKDRGTIKWTSLMLPEHVEQLKNLWSESNLIPKPILDEQELEELNNQCLEVFSNQNNIEVTIYKTGIKETYCGVICKLDAQNRVLHLQTNKAIEKIAISSIIKITTS